MTPLPRFVKAGLPVDSALLLKLYQFGKVLKHVRSPFSDDPLAHTEAQMDWLMEMFASEHPEEYEFVRPNRIKPLSAHEKAAKWDVVLQGRAKMDFLKPMMPSEAVLRRAREIAEMGAFVKAGGINKANTESPPVTTNPVITNIGKLRPQ
jgi:hypothetical protein